MGLFTGGHSQRTQNQGWGGVYRAVQMSSLGYKTMRTSVIARICASIVACVSKPAT